MERVGRVRAITARSHGLERDSVVSCDNILTVPVTSLGRLIGYLHATAEPDLSTAIRSAFELT